MDSDIADRRLSPLFLYNLLSTPPLSVYNGIYTLQCNTTQRITRYSHLLAALQPFVVLILFAIVVGVFCRCASHN